MVTGIVARRKGGQVLGVDHRDDSEPWILGNALLAAALDHAGDLAGLVREVIERAPAGWRAYPLGDRIEDPRAAPRSLEVDGEGLDVEWLYVFDVEGRTLEVWFDPTGPTLEPALFTVTFDPQGRASTPLFRQPPPESPTAKVVGGWKGDNRLEKAFRARMADALDADPARIGRFVEAAIAGAIRASTWTAFEEEAPEQRLRERLGLPPPPVPRLWDDERRLWLMRPFGPEVRRGWEVAIEDFRVRYPVADERADDDLGEDYVLLRSDGAFASLPPLLQLLPAFLDDGADAPTMPLLRAGVAAAVGDGIDYEIQDGRLYMFKAVVEAVATPQRQIALADARAYDADTRVGETLGWDLPPYGGLWSLLSWLRSRQLSARPAGAG